MLGDQRIRAVIARTSGTRRVAGRFRMPSAIDPSRDIAYSGPESLRRRRSRTLRTDLLGVPGSMDRNAFSIASAPLLWPTRRVIAGQRIQGLREYHRNRRFHGGTPERRLAPSRGHACERQLLTHHGRGRSKGCQETLCHTLDRVVALEPKPSAESTCGTTSANPYPGTTEQQPVHRAPQIRPTRKRPRHRQNCQHP